MQCSQFKIAWFEVSFEMDKMDSFEEFEDKNICVTHKQPCSLVKSVGAPTECAYVQVELNMSCFAVLAESISNCIHVNGSGNTTH